MNRRKWHIRIVIGVIAMLSSYASYAQDPTDSLPGDPAALLAYNVQNLAFGSFAQGASGGTVTVNAAGVRSSTGTILPLNIGSYYQSIFEVEAPPGSIIVLTSGSPTFTLTGSNGGTVSLVVNLGSNTSPASPFLTTALPPARTTVNIGGTITVGNSTASPPGSYTGTFDVIFNIQ
jgi:hypothetical protein